MKILYGANTTYIDVTNIVLTKCIENNSISIPPTEIERATLFSDPLHGVVKHIIIQDDYGNTATIPANLPITIPILPDSTIDLRKEKHRQTWWETVGKNIHDPISRLNTLQTYIHMPYGSFKDEYPEQLMSIKFLDPNSKVLEIGGNIGRNSSIIATILNSDKNLVSLESDPSIAQFLESVRTMNNFSFSVENSALSERRLKQSGWNTKLMEPNEVLNGVPNWKEVNTITWDNLLKKYNIQFDTLVADCEGALYYILKDRPDILDNIKTIIVENDYLELDKYTAVEDIFVSKGFCVIYSTPLIGEYYHLPCKQFFFQVWKKV